MHFERESISLSLICLFRHIPWPASLQKDILGQSRAYYTMSIDCSTEKYFTFSDVLNITSLMLNLLDYSLP